MAVRINDQGLRWLQANIRALNSHVLTLGYQGPSGQLVYMSTSGRAGPNLATVALYNEFGTKTIPARPALRSAIWVHQNRIREILTEAATAVVNSLDGFSPSRAVVREFGRAGHEICTLIRLHIQRSRTWAKPNASSTAEKKGFDYPLHETNWWIATKVSWAVRKWAAEGPIIAQGF